METIVQLPTNLSGDNQSLSIEDLQNTTTNDQTIDYYQLFSDYLINILNSQYNCSNTNTSIVECFQDNLDENATLYINITDMRVLLTPIYQDLNDAANNDEHIKQFIDAYRYNYCRVFYDGIFCKEYLINYDNPNDSQSGTQLQTVLNDEY